MKKFSKFYFLKVKRKIRDDIVHIVLIAISFFGFYALSQIQK